MVEHWQRVDGFWSRSADSNDWTIIYDPNTHNETMEENFNFQEAAEVGAARRAT